LAVAAATALGLTGCSSSGSGSGGKSTAAPSSTSAAAPSSGASASSAAPSAGVANYSHLLITATDIPVAGFIDRGTQPLPGTTKGISRVFANADDTREVGDILVITPSAAAAKTAVTAAVRESKTQLTGFAAKAVDFGDGGQLVTGVAAQKQRSAAVFSVGNVLVTVEFDSAKGDPVPDDVVGQVAGAQAAKIKANPPS
jgi:hypothetical protein